MLVTGPNGAYTRKGDLTDDWKNAIKLASEELLEKLRESTIASIPTLVSEGDSNMDMDMGDDMTPSTEEERVDTAEGCDEGMEPLGGMVATEPGLRKKVLYWNSNGWDVDKARRIAQVVGAEEVNAVCIIDTKQDSIASPQKLKHWPSISTPIQVGSGRVCTPPPSRA
jgi:hypothetical protein